jgi:hypothetical protein
MFLCAWIGLEVSVSSISPCPDCGGGRAPALSRNDDPLSGELPASSHGRRVNSGCRTRALQSYGLPAGHLVDIPAPGKRWITVRLVHPVIHAFVLHCVDPLLSFFLYRVRVDQAGKFEGRCSVRAIGQPDGGEIPVLKPLEWGVSWDPVTNCFKLHARQCTPVFAFAKTRSLSYGSRRFRLPIL